MNASAALRSRLRARIAQTGPITFRDWMDAALYDERGGYYARPDLARWGRTGDYRTSPECSPLFAATCAHYFAQLYTELGTPERWTIIEAGAGNGRFAAGVLDTFAHEHPALLRATQYVIDERSADAQARARELLDAHVERVDYASLFELSGPVRGGLIFANELLDALPVHRVVQRGGQLRELCVGLDGAGKFIWVECAPGTPRLAEHFARLHVTLAEGQAAEVNLAAADWITQAAHALARGFIMLIDYGAEATALYDVRQRPDGTLRAFQQHQLSADVLARPGEQDLTTTVNWTQIKQAAAAAGLRTVLHVRQDEFLLRAGLLEQLERMSARLPDEAACIALRLSAREMLLPGGMSQSFQVLVLEK